VTGTTRYTEDGRPAVRVERALRHPVVKVWRALTEPSQLNQWFPFDVETALAVGAEVRFVDRHGGPSGTGTITELDPPRLLAYSWESDHLRWELRSAAGGSLLVLTHTVVDRFGAASFASGWHACLDGLESVLLGRPVGPPGDMDAAHEHWLAEFGLAEPEVTDGPDGWRIRFERQLVRPADLAWRELVAGGSEPVVGGPVPAGALIVQSSDSRAADRITDLTADRITELAPAKVLAYAWLAEGTPAGQIRWELGEGTGHGARLVLTVAGRPDRSAARATAQTGAQQRIATLAAALRNTSRRA